MNEEGEKFGMEWDVQKGSEVSTWIATPKYKKGGKMFADRDRSGRGNELMCRQRLTGMVMVRRDGQCEDQG